MHCIALHAHARVLDTGYAQFQFFAWKQQLHKGPWQTQPLCLRAVSKSWDLGLWLGCGLPPCVWVPGQGAAPGLSASHLQHPSSRTHQEEPPGATLTSPTCGQIWGVFLCRPWFIFPDLLVVIQAAAGSLIQLALEYILSFWGPRSLVWKLGQLGSLPELTRVLAVPGGLQGGFIQGLRGLPPGLREDRKWCPLGSPSPYSTISNEHSCCIPDLPAGYGLWF